MPIVSPAIATLGVDGWAVNPAYLPPGAQAALVQGTNAYGVQTPVPLALGAPLSAQAVATAPVIDFITTWATDGDATGNTHQDWGGMQKELAVRMADGTIFCARIQNNAGVDRLQLHRSPTGGAVAGNANWPVVATVATDFFKSIVLRDRSRDHVFWITMQGSSLAYQVKIMVFNSSGSQVGSTYTVNQAGLGIAQDISNNGFYINAGVGTTGRVVLSTWMLPQPAAAQNNTTLQCIKRVQWLFWDGATWTQDPVKMGPPTIRFDYDNIVIGADGDPDMVYGLTQGNVAMWEAVSYFTPERLSQARLSGFYAFDRWGVWWHNRRTGAWGGPKFVSPNIPWQIHPWDGDGSSYNASNDIPEARHRQALLNPVTGEWWVPYRLSVPKPYATGLTFTGSISGNTLTVTAITGTPLSVGTTITAHSLATTGMLPTKIIALGTGVGGTGTYILDSHQTIASGTVSACNPANPSTTQAPTATWRVAVVTLKGEVKWDGDVLSVGYGNMSLAATASGRIYAVFIALGSNTTNTNFHVWELTRQTDGAINTIALDLASQRNSDNNPTGNVGWGCVNAYLGGAITAPARSSNQGPIFPDPQHGSALTTNTIDVIVSRRATDHSAGGTATNTNDDTAHKMDLVHMRVPA